MLCFVTDLQSASEPDILGALRYERLAVRALDGSLIVELGPPPGGWTHSDLVAQSVRLERATADGADAFLGMTWVGSTEV